MNKNKDSGVDAEMVKQFLNVMLPREFMIELRVLQPDRLCGYFKDASRLINAVQALPAGAAIYIVPQQIAPALYDRAPEVLVPARKGMCTSESDVERLTRLVIDIDPKRSSGIAATDAEVDAARKRMEKIRAHLSDAAWPEPIVAFSGNGFYLIHAIDLPRSDKALIAGVMKSLAQQFDDDRVHVDTAMAKPAQPSRLVGTLNAKGLSTVDRPHRMSRIISMPDRLEPVPREKMEKLAKTATTSRKPNGHNAKPKDSHFDVEGWVRKCAPDAQGPTDWKTEDGTFAKRWVLPVCPWRPDHTNSSAFIAQFPDGRIHAGCHHKSCEDETWETLRDKFEPGWQVTELLSSYVATPNGICKKDYQKGKLVLDPITNFTAKIIAELIRDDGVETTRAYRIAAHVGGKDCVVTVPCDDFSSMVWIPRELGAQAVMVPGQLNRDHVRAAIQLISGDIPVERVYLHTGWCKHGGLTIYLHAGGAIGPEGTVVGVHTELPFQLRHALFPDPPEKDKLREAVAASLRFLDVAPPLVSHPLFAAVFRAPLGPFHGTVHLYGPSGLGKTAIIALAQQFFGPGFVATDLPLTWSSTTTAIQACSNLAKDFLLTIDDYAPQSTSAESQRQDQGADRVLRAQGNGNARQRGGRDGSIRPPKDPQSLMVSTGEDVPPGQSVNARLIVAEVSDPVNWAVVTECQQSALAGLFVAVMSAYVKFIAANYDTIMKRVRSDVVVARARYNAEGQHRRTADMLAELEAGVSCFATFCSETGALSPERAQKLVEGVSATFTELAKRQQAGQDDVDPTTVFIDKIRSALLSGRAHVRPLYESVLPSSTLWGLSEVENDRESRRIPKGDAIGWLSGDDLYLDPDAAYALVQRELRTTNQALGVTKTTLGKRMFKKGLLKSAERDRNRNTMRISVDGSRVEVLHLAATTIHPTEQFQPSPEAIARVQELLAKSASGRRPKAA